MKKIKVKNRERKQKKYSMTYVCRNCGKGFEQWFEFGEVARKGTCPFCGVGDWDLRHQDISGTDL